MSDFVSGFWSMYIAGIVLLGILGCLILLIFSAKASVSAASDNTTGHVWDGDLREMNNPLPRWWSYLFVITLLFGLIYLALYPGLGKSSGLLGWTSRDSYTNEMTQGDKETAAIYARFNNMTTQQIARDEQAMAIGERLFSNNCSQCHASDARGQLDFPNLTDGDWLHGGTPENITETITNGRYGVMPAMAEALGTPEDVKNVANYALSLSPGGRKIADLSKAALGKEKFETICAACHGVDGKGMQMVGAANLTDDIWLHGFGEQAVLNMIEKGKTNIMPAQAYHLTEPQIKVLTAYVWGMSNRN